MALIMIVSLTPAIAAETPESEISPEAFEEKMESDAQKARDNRSRILKNAEETIEKLKTAEKE